jgi:hypothetical protein
LESGFAPAARPGASADLKTSGVRAPRRHPVFFPVLLMTGGCERTEDEYRALYRDSGFELTQAIPTTSPTGNTVIESRPI